MICRARQQPIKYLEIPEDLNNALSSTASRQPSVSEKLDSLAQRARNVTFPSMPPCPARGPMDAQLSAYPSTLCQLRRGSPLAPLGSGQLDPVEAEVARGSVSSKEGERIDLLCPSVDSVTRASPRLDGSSVFFCWPYFRRSTGTN